MSDFKTPTCPECHKHLSSRERDRLIAVGRFNRVLPCGQCGERLQWNSAAKITLKRIFYVWLVAACFLFLGVLGTYNLVPFVSGYGPLLNLLGLSINMACIAFVYYRAQHFSLESAGR